MMPNFLCASCFAGPLFFMGCFTFVVGMAFFYYYSGKLFFLPNFSHDFILYCQDYINAHFNSVKTIFTFPEVIFISFLLCRS